MSVMLALPVAAVALATYAAYTSLKYVTADKTLAYVPPPIYEEPEAIAFSSDNLRFNPRKQLIHQYAGQFGLPEGFLADGLGCLNRVSEIGLGEAPW